MQIVFIHPSKAFLPELDAYARYFSKIGIKTAVSTTGQSVVNADVEWHFMGVLSKRKPVITIHEYASASVPPFASFKDLIKRKINCKPDFRIYNNEYVRERLGFADGIPEGIRDFGIEQQLPASVQQKEYDFIYTGSVAAHRKLDDLLNCFTDGALRNQSLLILSNNYTQLANKMRPFKNIRFEGPVPHHQVNGYLKKASFGINFMADVAPFNHQTSAKLVEYAAAGLPILTNAYAWLDEFERKTGGTFFKINKDFTNVSWEAIQNFSFRQPDLREWTWEEQIRKSGVVEFLNSKDPKNVKLKM